VKTFHLGLSFCNCTALSYFTPVRRRSMNSSFENPWMSGRLASVTVDPYTLNRRLLEVNLNGERLFGRGQFVEQLREARRADFGTRNETARFERPILVS